MDLREMKYFLTIAEEGSITAAAHRLHIAQPPLSRQMKQMEDQLGVQLFERGRRQVKLTDAGKLLRSRTEQIFELLNDTIKELHEYDTGLRGTLSIGTVTSGATLLPNLIRKFRYLYPDVLFRLREGETRRITELLDRGIVELGMVRVPFNTELYESVSLPNEPLVIAFKSTTFEKRKHGVISLSDLAGKPLMIHRKYTTLLTEQCQQQGFLPYILCESDDVMPLLAWADADIGIAVVPKSVINLIPSTNLIAMDIIEPPLETTAAIIWARNRYLSTTARNFIKLFTMQNT